MLTQGAKFGGGKYLLGNKIGRGAYGDIHVGTIVENNKKVAIKLEPHDTKCPCLSYEAKVYRIMQGGTGIPHFYWYGEETGYNILVMELLGPSIEQLFKKCKKLSVATTLSIADQMIGRIEHFHNKCYLHRDVKPDNFVIGTGDSSSTIYIIDYGLAKRYRDAKTSVHISFRDHKKLTGTTRYASLSTHLGAEQSRRDDLECLAYTLIYLLKGELPWQGMAARNKQEKYDKVRDLKGNTSTIETLCKGLDSEFGIFLGYCRSLKFEEKPDYSRAKKLLRDVFYRKKCDSHFEMDWIRLKMETTVPEDKDWSDSDTNQAENEAKAEATRPSGNVLQLPSQLEAGGREANQGQNSSVSQRSRGYTFTTSKADLSPLPSVENAGKEVGMMQECGAKMAEPTQASVCKELKEVEEDKTNFATRRCNFLPEDIVEDHSLYEDTIPDEKPLNVSISVPQCTYINNRRHWDKYRRREHEMSLYFSGTEYPLRKRTYISEKLGRLMTHVQGARKKAKKFVSGEGDEQPVRVKAGSVFG